MACSSVVRDARCFNFSVDSTADLATAIEPITRKGTMEETIPLAMLGAAARSVTFFALRLVLPLWLGTRLNVIRTRKWYTVWA